MRQRSSREVECVLVSVFVLLLFLSVCLRLFLCCFPKQQEEICTAFPPLVDGSFNVCSAAKVISKVSVTVANEATAELGPFLKS